MAKHDVTVRVSFDDESKRLLRQLIAAVDRLHPTFTPLDDCDGVSRRLVEREVRPDPGGLY
jgi:hypothetical protein